MKSSQQILSEIKSGKSSECLDGRDFGRLADYFPVSDWQTFGMKPTEGFDVASHVPKELTRENVLTQLASDLEFGFEKALNQRGLSAGFMYEVVKMWLWVLDDELQNMTEYAQYGLPLFKAVAVKYGLPNPIGDDRGDESQYASS